MTDNNVTDLDAWKVAKVITDYWLDCYSDNGAIYEKSKRALDAVKAVCPPEMWEEALTIANNHWDRT